MSRQAEVVRSLLATLVAGGLRHLVISPGSRSTPLVQAANERAELTLHVVLDERAAGFFALGLARATQTLCGTVCTSGSAVAHVLPAAIEATESGDALVALTADRPAAVRGLGASQAILQPGLLAPYAQHFAEIDAQHPDVDALLATLQHALGEASSRGGVVHVNVPLSLPLALTPGDLPLLPSPLTAPQRPLQPAVPPPAPNERVLLLAGPLAFSDDVAPFLRARLPRHQVVVFAEPASRLRDALGSVRHADAFLRDAEVRAALLPDRILRLGAWPISKGAQLVLEDAKRLGIPADTVQPRRFSDPLRQNRLTSLDGIPDALRLWPVADGQREPLPWIADWQVIDAAVAPPASDWHEASAIDAVARTLHKEQTLVLGNSMPVRDWESFAPELDAHIHVEVSRGAAGIDGTLATIAGLAVGRAQQVTAYLGDCTFLHDVGSLQILAQLNGRHAGIRLCVVDNDGGAIFDYLPARSAMPESVHVACFTTPHGLNLAEIARGFGLDVIACADLAAWRDAVAEPVRPGRTQVLLARFERTSSEAMHRAYWLAAGQAGRLALSVRA